MQLANQQAMRLKDDYIDSEHILFGLVAEGAGVAANVLKQQSRVTRLESSRTSAGLDRHSFSGTSPRRKAF